MTLLAPAALLLVVVALPVVMLYVLRLRRPERTVSSTLLWPDLVGDMQANAPWQRLRPGLLLLLQLLAVAGLVLALARPAFSRTALVTRDVIVVLDQSFSMRAHDVSPSRFGEAQARARSLASSLSSGNVMSVIGMSDQPHLAIAESSDGGAIDRAIDDLVPGSSTPNLLAALSLAASLARQGERTEAVILTDHSSGIRALPFSVHFSVVVERLGGIRRDVGITGFSATGGKSTSAVVRVRNYGGKTATSDLDIFANGRLVDVRPLTVPAGGQQVETWDSLPQNTRTLRAHLTAVDDMQADKTAWAVVPSEEQRRILLVSAGGYFLRTALSLQPGVILHAVTPSAYTPSLAAHSDVVVFDGLFPDKLPPVPAMLVGPPAGRIAGIKAGREKALDPGAVVSTTGSNPITHYVDLSDVRIARVRSVVLPDWMHPLAEVGGFPVLAAGQVGNARLALIPFAVEESDWPLRVSFPIAMHNLLGFLAPGTVVTASQVTTGAPVVIVPPANTRSVRVVEPGGVSETLNPPFPPFAATTSAGVYRVETSPPGISGVFFAANFFSAHSPDTRGASTLRLGRPSTGRTRAASSETSVEWAFSLAVLALLSVEWWVAFKR